MRRIRLYWNNICVLHKGEVGFLKQIKGELALDGIELEITCFGLGYPFHMSEYLTKEDSLLPDMIVSTDLEVFEDRAVFSRLSDSLVPLGHLFAIKSDEVSQVVDKGAYLLPYLIIPLVFYTRDFSVPKTLSLEAAAAGSMDITFGGINNSAAKSVVKTVWANYGKAKLLSLFKNARVTDMPVEAFALARRGVKSLALVPSLFALGDMEGRAFVPSDGAVALPSYICAMDSVSLHDVKKVVKALNAEAFLDFFRNKGRLITMKQGAFAESWFKENGGRLQMAPQSWIENLDDGEFAAVYKSLMPSAVI